MKRLKIILQSNLFCILLFLLLIIYIFLCNLFNSKEDIKCNEFFVIDYKIDNDKLILELKNDIKVIANYYYDVNDSFIDDIKYGTKIRIQYEISDLNNNTIPNTFDYKTYLENNNISYKLNISKIEIVEQSNNFIFKFKNLINDRLNVVDDTGYIRAFILGNKSFISDNVYDAYISCGIGHLFALSGMHVSLLTSFLFLFLKFKNKVVKYFFISIFLICYGFIVGFSPSILRCIVFLIISFLFEIFSLKIHSIKKLYFTCIIVLFINYKYIFDVGFLYSFLTVFGIIFCQDFINGNWFLKSLKLSIVAFLFSLPVSLYSFYSINLLSIIYNIVFIPFISIVVYPFSILCFIFPFLNCVFEFLIFILENIVLFLSSIDFFILNLNFNIFEFVLFYLFLLIGFKFRKYYFFLVSLLIIFIDIFLPYFDNNNYVYYFDVGQGDSSLIISSNRSDVIMIDTGGSINSSFNVTDNIITFYKSIGLNKVDYLILTHGDYDHMGEAINLVNNFKVEKVIFNCGEYNDLEKELIKVLEKKKIPYYSCLKELNIDDNKLYFLNNKDYGNENDNSSVIYTELNNYKFLFMGDAGIEVEDDLIKKYNFKNIDVLKVGHHGSQTSSSKEFIDEVNPKYSIISVGKNNRYGHPNKEVLEYLNDSKIYRTDQDGSIMFKIKINKLEIEACAP